MHSTAMMNGKRFFECYGSSFSGPNVRVVDIGAQDLNGSLREGCPRRFEYVGVDFAAGKGVDIVIDDPYDLPFDAESTDIVVSSSCFEHSEMFWLVFLEGLRILKPRGLFYLNAPSNGNFHRFPVDCWRFYPDSGKALVTWAKRNDIDAVLLESFTCCQVTEVWNDYVAVFLKDRSFVSDFPARIIHSFDDFDNGQTVESGELLNYTEFTEDQRKVFVISQILKNEIKVR